MLIIIPLAVLTMQPIDKVPPALKPPPVITPGKYPGLQPPPSDSPAHCKEAARYSMPPLRGPSRFPFTPK